jgi:hypothetical protein
MPQVVEVLGSNPVPPKKKKMLTGKNELQNCPLQLVLNLCDVFPKSYKLNL